MSNPRNILRGFLRDEGAFLLSSESLLLGTVCVIGLIVGLAEVRNAVVEELGDFSDAVASLSQDYAYTSVESTNVNLAPFQTSGAAYDDDIDNQQNGNLVANGIIVDTTADLE